MDTQTAAPAQPLGRKAQGHQSPEEGTPTAALCALGTYQPGAGAAWVREAFWSSGIGPRPRALPPLSPATTDFLPPSFPTTSCHRAKVKRPTHREPFPKHLRVPGSTPEVQIRRGDGRGSEAQAPRSRDILWFCSLAAPGTQEALSLEGMVLTDRFLKSGLKRCLHNSSVTTVREACRPRLPHLTSWPQFPKLPQSPHSTGGNTEAQRPVPAAVSFLAFQKGVRSVRLLRRCLAPSCPTKSWSQSKDTSSGKPSPTSLPLRPPLLPTQCCVSLPFCTVKA